MVRSPRVKWVEEQIRKRYATGLILDVGFVGSYEEPFLHLSLREKNPAVRFIGVDINLQSVLKHRLSDTLVGDGQKLPFQDCIFDAILCLEVLEHIHCPEKILKEFYRVLHPEGELIITTPNAFAWWNVIRYWLLGSLKSRTQRAVYKGYLGAPDHIRFYDPLSLMNILQENGFETVEISTKNHAIPLFRRWIRWLRLLDLEFWPMNRLGHYICLIARKV